jgi:hypothetical protein
MSRGNPLVKAKEKGNKLANKAKDKGKLMKPKPRSKLKTKERRTMCHLKALQWPQEAKKLILAALQ